MSKKTQREKRWYTHKVKEDTPRMFRRFFHGPRTSVSYEVVFWLSYTPGWGITLGRNGSESDVGLDVHLGRFLNAYLRLASPWTRWANINDHEKYLWYEARHYGFRIRPYDGCWWRIELGETEFTTSSEHKRSWSFRPESLLGKTNTETIILSTGMTEIPMKEGAYPAAWTQEVTIWTYTRLLGKIRDRLLKPRTNTSVTLDIPGGIPVEGKGENSWDCGMNGLFGITGKTVEEAVGNCVVAVTRDRNRYGGPHNLPRAMTAAEAEEHIYKKEGP